MARIEALEIFDGTAEPAYDVEKIVANFTAIPLNLKIKLEPMLVVGHEENQHWLKDSGMPAGGWIDRIWLVGKKIIASVADVPQKLAELINRRAYRKVSVEIYPDFAGQGPALRRVALLGGELPQIKTLDDFLALYADSQTKAAWVSAYSETDQKGGEVKTVQFEEKKTMPEMTQEQIDKIVSDRVAAAARVQADELAKVKTEMAAKFSEADAKHAADLKAATDVATALSARVQLGETQLSAERVKAKAAVIDAFIEKHQATGQIVPAELDAGLRQQLLALDDVTVVQFGEGDKAVKKTLLQSQLDIISARQPVVKFGEQAKAGDGTPGAEWKTDVVDTVTGEKIPKVKAATIKNYAEHEEDYRRMGVTLTALAKGDSFGVKMR